MRTTPGAVVKLIAMDKAVVLCEVGLFSADLSSSRLLPAYLLRTSMCFKSTVAGGLD